MHRSRARSARAPAVFVLSVLGLVVATATAETPKIYKWVDANGIAHYTTDPERVPKALRERVQSVERRAPVTPAPSATPDAEGGTGSDTPTAAAQPGTGSDTPTAAAQPGTGSDTPTAAAEPGTGGDTPTTTAQPGTGGDTAGPVAEPGAATAAAPEPRAPLVAPAPATVRSEDWFHRDALPRVDRSAVLASGQASPEVLEVLAAERETLDARIAEVEAEIAEEEGVLKGLISDPQLDEEVPLFDRPEFLEISQRLPQLQAQLEELREERAKLEIP